MAEPPEPRQRLLEAGLELFARQGIGATGIEQLLERADVAKMTLYKQFGSKEGLAEAVLENYGQRVRSALFEGIEKAPGPRAALLSLFESAGRLVAAPDWRGCLFARAALEFGPPEDPLHQIASAHQALLAERLTELARAAGVAQPAPLVQACCACSMACCCAPTCCAIPVWPASPGTAPPTCSMRPARASAEARPWRGDCGRPRPTNPLRRAGARAYTPRPTAGAPPVP